MLDKIKDLKDLEPFQRNFTHQPEVREGYEKFKKGEFNSIEECKDWILKQKLTCFRDDPFIEHLNILNYFDTGKFHFKQFEHLNEQFNHLQGQLLTFKFYRNAPKRQIVLLTSAFGCVNALCHDLTENKLVWISWDVFDNVKKPKVNRIKKNIIQQLF